MLYSQVTLQMGMGCWSFSGSAGLLLGPFSPQPLAPSHPYTGTNPLWPLCFGSMFCNGISDVSRSWFVLNHCFPLNFFLLVVFLPLISFIWHFSCFLRQACIIINFPFRTFLVPHRFCIIVFLFSFVSRYFFISPLIYSVTHWL